MTWPWQSKARLIGAPVKIYIWALPISRRRAIGIIKQESVEDWTLEDWLEA